MPAADSPLMLDIREDLIRVDQAMTQVIADPTTIDDFVRDPSMVLARLRLHARTTRDVHDRANRIFYATLANAELLNFLAELFEGFQPPAEVIEEDRVAVRDSLSRGGISHAVSLDMAAAEYVTADRDVVRRIYQLSLHDLNDRRLLVNHYSPQEIDDFVDRLATAIVDGLPIREMPLLEEWDSQYGVGARRHGVNYLELAIPVTLGAHFEVIAWTTVEAWGFTTKRAVAEDAARRGPRDMAAARTIATAGALMNLAGEVLLHAESFERR